MTLGLHKNDSIFVAGHQGMVGSAVCRNLRRHGCSNLLTVERGALDLTCQRETLDFVSSTNPKAIVLAAAKVGGIHANDAYPAEFIHQNLVIQCNLLHSAHATGVERVIFLGSSCIYPKFAKQPISENELLSGPLEPTNEPYAIAKIAGIKLCESYNRQYGTDFRSLMPTNLYGPGDNFNLETSHVVPALMLKIHRAKNSGSSSVKVWGTGKARREFLHVDDLASAVTHFLFLQKDALEKSIAPRQSHVNIGTGTDISIAELAELLSELIGYSGRLDYDTSMPDGTPLKRLNTSLAEELGWTSAIELRQGLQSTYDWFCKSEIAQSTS